jgi:hypothetical protein
LLVAEQDREAHNALVDGPDLGGVAIRHGVDQRTDAGLKEIDEFDGLVDLVERAFVFKANGFEMRAQSRVVTVR